MPFALNIAASANWRAQFIFGNMLLKWSIGGRFPVDHLVALIALALLIPAAEMPMPVVLSAAATLVLVALAICERKMGYLCPRHQGSEIGQSGLRKT